jgi:dihydrofolate reductase
MLSLIVALTANERVIGRAGGLPWRLSADLKRFKRLTMGHHLVMGRKTFDSIGRALPGRTSVVITRRPREWPQREGIVYADSLAAALNLCGDDPEVFVVGGGEIFAEALPLANRAYVTWIEASIAGDTYFPAFPTDAWREISTEHLPADAANEFPTRYCVYERSA